MMSTIIRSNLQQTMKYLYLVNHFVPFPSSEYGGLWAVTAQDDDECFDLITDYDDGFNQKFYVELRENIVDGQRFALQENEGSRVVEAFTT
jgi:hypothetical protein